MRKSKYNAHKVKYDSYTFDSRKEYNRYLELKVLKGAGYIRSLEVHRRFEIVPALYVMRGLVSTVKVHAESIKYRKKEHYVSDFVYIDNKTGETVIEDVKGSKETKAYQIFKKKKEMVYKRYGIKIIEI